MRRFNLKLGQNLGPKQAGKLKSAGDSERQKAFAVLFDVLTAQLMKPQNFLREMANYVFKQFCKELDAASLEHLIDIVATPNERDGEIVEEDSNDDEDDDEDGEEEIDEDISEDSDDI